MNITDCKYNFVKIKNKFNQKVFKVQHNNISFCSQVKNSGYKKLKNIYLDCVTVGI